MLLSTVFTNTMVSSGFVDTHVPYAAFTHDFISKWKYLMKCIPTIESPSGRDKELYHKVLK